MEPLTKRMIAREDRNARAGDVTMRMLAPTLHYDFQLITESEGPLERFNDIRADLLLLGGTKSLVPSNVRGDLVESVSACRTSDLAGTRA